MLVKVRSDAFLRWSDFMCRHQLWLRQRSSLASSPTAGFNRNRGENWFLFITVSLKFEAGLDSIVFKRKCRTSLKTELVFWSVCECQSWVLSPWLCQLPCYPPSNLCLHSYIRAAGCQPASLSAGHFICSSNLELGQPRPSPVTNKM